eukprot:CAMPEP_0206430704 /NCGR_PEP_ID=MMETSP0324_2-20121206/6962_1 /ASSEMBLY_ACC=CAM_ASM_000836 /TAXON_ID=2866 /ORGANISM="Crypthecodinium cohnii, Strain Seligo" /LENGTH=160 /DNA_ID=CAMNT_0053896561 /DNA_START=675 /DNA_END=1155 /DNA_ORIENTATION=+
MEAPGQGGCMHRAFLPAACTGVLTAWSLPEAEDSSWSSPELLELNPFSCELPVITAVVCCVDADLSSTSSFRASIRPWTSHSGRVHKEKEDATAPWVSSKIGFAEDRLVPDVSELGSCFCLRCELADVGLLPTLRIDSQGQNPSWCAAVLAAAAAVAAAF